MNIPFVTKSMNDFGSMRSLPPSGSEPASPQIMRILATLPYPANGQVQRDCRRTCTLPKAVELWKVREPWKTKFKSAPNKIGLQPAPMLDLWLGAVHLTGQ